MGKKRRRMLKFDSVKKFLFDKYRREVSDNAYQSTFDGIRFLAVISVILCHISNHSHVYGRYQLDARSLREVYIYNLFQGVSLFFILSAFLLSNYLLKQDILAIFFTYLRRRFKRIYPPYFVALCIAFVVFVLYKITFSEAIRHFLMSAFFSSNFFYPEQHPLLLPIAWTLEVEVQFYLLLPLLLILYKHLPWLKYIMIAAVLFIPVLGAMSSFYHHTALFFQLPYFFVGILLSDLYQRKKANLLPDSNSLLTYLLFTGSVVLLLSINWYYYTFNGIHIDLAPIAFFIMLYLILFRGVGRNLLQNKWIAFIGNMGYSLYLTHMFVISFVGKIFLNLRITEYFLVNFLLQTILLMPVILVVAYLFYTAIEFPFMKTKNK